MEGVGLPLNPRLFLPGCRASAEAARAWLGAPEPPEGARHLLLEGLAVSPEAGAGVAVAHAGSRAWLSGSAAGLLAVCRAHPRLAPAAAAVAAFEAALAAPVRPLIMGILNVTPDSFSDGGRYLDPETAVARGLEMAAEGADVLDVGGESTRPGAAEVPAAEELRRVLPVIAGLRGRTTALLSVDTRKAAVAGPCLEAGADWVNDVSGLTFDPALAGVIAARPATRLVLMHSRARPAAERYSTEWNPDGAPHYEDVVADVLRALRGQAAVALAAGVRREQLWLDPGFGFGKTFEQNVDLLRRLREFTAAGFPLLVGTSRKSSVGRLVGDLPPSDRLEGSLVTAAWALREGAAAVRVHDVRETARAVRCVRALTAGP